MKLSRLIDYVRIAILAAMLLVILAFTIHYWRIRHRFENHVADLRAADTPTTAHDIAEIYSVPPGRTNAADLYQHAFDEFKPIIYPIKMIDRSYEMEAPYRPQTLSEDEQRLIRSWLKANDKTVELLIEAAAIPDCAYPVDFSLGPEADLSHLGRIRRCHALILTRAYYQAVDGDYEDAWVCAGAALSLAQSLSKEPILVSQFVFGTLFGRSFDSVSELFLIAPVSRDEADVMLERMATFSPGRMEDTILAERVAALNTVLASGDKPSFIDADFTPAFRNFVWKPLYSWTGMKYLDVLHTSEALEAQVEHYGLPLSERYETGGRPQRQAIVQPLFMPLTQYMLPAIRHTRDVELDVAIRLELLQGSYALAAHAAENGSAPDNIAELVPEYLGAIPADPVFDAPLIYRVGERFADLYFAGLNRADNGGPSSWQGDGTSGSDDIGLRIAIDPYRP